jgi:hypothetical protein
MTLNDIFLSFVKVIQSLQSLLEDPELLLVTRIIEAYQEGNPELRDFIAEYLGIDSQVHDLTDYVTELWQILNGSAWHRIDSPRNLPRYFRCSTQRRVMRLSGRKKSKIPHESVDALKEVAQSESSSPIYIALRLEYEVEVQTLVLTILKSYDLADPRRAFLQDLLKGVSVADGLRKHNISRSTWQSTQRKLKKMYGHRLPAA